MKPRLPPLLLVPISVFIIALIGLLVSTAVAVGPEISVEQPAGTPLGNSVVAWGNNDYGQTNVPAGLTGVQAIAAGGSHTAAVKYPTVAMGSLSVGTSSAAKTFSIKNTGNAPLNLTSVSVIGGNASDFSVNTTGMLTSVPDTTGETTFTVSFTPSVPGTRFTTLRVVSDDPDENPFDVRLFGTGQGNEIAVTRYEVDIADGDSTPSDADGTDFGSINFAATVTRTYTIANLGNIDLTLGPGAITLTGLNTSDFAISGISLPATISGGLKVTFAVTFDPSTPGLRTATVNIANNDTDEGSFDFAIQGSSFVAPEISVEQPVGMPLGGVLAWGRNDDGETNIPAGLTGVRAIAAGGGHTVALKFDGTVVAWGYNSAGQTSVPVGLSGVQAIAAGGSHTVALKSDRTVVAWGYNYSGQTNVPTGLVGVEAISAGSYHTVALKSDGTVVVWGNSFYGQTSVPAGLTGVVAIAASSIHTVALKSDGTVVAWGDNSSGQTNVPVGLTGVRAIAAGYHHSVALKNDGTVIAWGLNTDGQTNVPVGLTGVRAIAAGGWHTLALKSDGTVVAWGTNTYGQTNVPAGLTGVQTIAAGGWHSVIAYPEVAMGSPSVAVSSAPKTVTIKNTGSAPLDLSSVSLVGGNTSDFSVNTAGMLTSLPEINSETTFTVTFTPRAVGLRFATLRIDSNDTDENPYFVQLAGTGIGPEIVVEYNSNEILDGDTTPGGTDNTDLGAVNLFDAVSTCDYSIINRGNADLILPAGAISFRGVHASDFAIGGITLPATIVAGSRTTFRVTFDPRGIGQRSAIVSIANNDFDENPFNFSIQGTGISAPEISVEQPVGSRLGNTIGSWGYYLPFRLIDVQAVAAGFDHAVALKKDGTVVAWGGYSSGQSDVPADLIGVQAIAAGRYFTIALKSDGTVVAWGNNNYGQTNVPAGLTGVQAIAAGDDFTVALLRDGTVVTWGLIEGLSNAHAGLTGVQAIAAGGGHAVALKSDGTVFVWGSYYYGQTNVPAGLTGVQAVAAGGRHTVALKNDGTVVAWGDNEYGQANVPAGLTGVQAISASWANTVALKSDGTVVAWGSSYYYRPTLVPAFLTGVKAIAAGGSAIITLMAPRVFFDFQKVGTTSAAKTFTLKNTGSAPLSLTSVSLIGGNASDFKVNTKGMLTSIPAVNGQTTFTVTFTPSAPGIRTTTLRVASNDADESTFDIHLASQAPEIVVSDKNRKITDGDVIDLGPLGVNALQPSAFYISNDGNASLNDVSVSITGINANQFKLSKAPAKTIRSYGGISWFTVEAKLTSLGAKTATLRIASNDADESPFDITLNATGVAASQPTAITGSSEVVASGSATLKGTIDANGLPRQVYFDYGTTTAYGNTVPADNPIESDEDPVSVAASLTYLLPHTTYHYRVRAESGQGNAEGANKTFLTPNKTPVGQDDFATVQPRATAIINVLSNDTDADNDPLIIRSKTAVTPASAGTVVIKDNRLVFTASAAFGTGDLYYATIGYTLSDTFAGGTATAELTIYAGGCALDPETKNLTSAGVIYPVDVFTNQATWSVTESISWLTVSPTQGTGNATVQVTVQPNTSTKSRSGIIKIGGVNHTITQEGVVAPVVSAAVLTGTTMTGPFDTIVGARGFSVSIPCTNLPVTFTVASGSLPPGLMLNATTGIISGIPSVGGSAAVPTKAYPLTIKATNFQGSSTTPSFTIHVEALPANVVGLYHGYVTPSAFANLTADPFLGGRLEMTTTSTGAVTGQIYEGVTKKSFAGTLSTTLTTKQNPTLNVAVTGTDYRLDLTLDAVTNTLSGDLLNTTSSTPVTAWRNAWRSSAPANKATRFLGQNNFFMRNTDLMNGPQGYGYASFSVQEATGAFTLSGKLADETKTAATIITNSFIGQQGQVLFYLPLYSNRGSCSGVLTCDPSLTGDNQTQGTLTWIKPQSLKDSMYPLGFGPLLIEAEGNLHVPPAPGQRVMNAAAGTTNNATLNFYNGGLSADFAQRLLILNPTATGLTNTAVPPTFNSSLTPNPNPNKVTLPTLNATSGLFSGSFTLPGTALQVAPFYGLIVRDVTSTTDSVQGYGYFMLPSIPTTSQTPATSPKQSGPVIFTAP